ncbi:MAG: ABC transporter ATP-binding protein [Mycobacteriaceae bacterium]
MNARAASIQAVGVSRRFGDTLALDDVSLALRPGELMALLGPSGCGKSSLLAVLAGLQSPDTGDVLLGGASVTGVPAERRPVSLVFQRPLLFPHLTVAANVGFGLRMARVGRAETRRRVDAALAQVRLDGLGSRRVGELSGGQEQRAALARALVLAPEVLLLDEPFSALDAALRSEMRALVRTLHTETGVSTLFVTHDQAEAVEVADRVTLMEAGRITGVGEPEMFYRHPPNLAAARFFGVRNELGGVVTAGRFTGGGVRAHTAAKDGPSVLVVRPEALRLHPAPGAGSGAGPGAGGAPVHAEKSELDVVVTSARFAGTHVVVEVVSRADAGATWTVHTTLEQQLPVGSGATLVVDPSTCTVFPA